MKKAFEKFKNSITIMEIVLVIMIIVVPSYSRASNEFRVGAVLQIPFGGGGTSYFQIANIRVGITSQYADVEDDDILIERHITNNYLDGRLKSQTVTNETVTIDEGDKVYGIEGNVFIQPFGSWNPSVEILGFYGNNNVQGAFGGGYDWMDGWFLDSKVMFPYSEIGLRFIAPFEIYAGGKTFGSFDPEGNSTSKEIMSSQYSTTPVPKPRTEVRKKPEIENVPEPEEIPVPAAVPAPVPVVEEEAAEAPVQELPVDAGAFL
jgi:hypothetical protein